MSKSKFSEHDLARKVFMLGNCDDGTYTTCETDCINCHISIKNRHYIYYQDYLMCFDCVKKFELALGPRHFINIPKYDDFVCANDSHEYELDNQFYVSPSRAILYAIDNNDHITVRKAIQKGVKVHPQHIKTQSINLQMMHVFHEAGLRLNNFDLYLEAVMVRNFDVVNFLWQLFHMHYDKSDLIEFARVACRYGDVKSANILFGRGINVFEAPEKIIQIGPYDIGQIYSHTSAFDSSFVAKNFQHQIFFETIYHPKIQKLLFKEARKRQIYIPFNDIRLCAKHFLKLEEISIFDMSLFSKNFNGCKTVLNIVAKEVRQVQDWKKICALISVMRATLPSQISNSIFNLMASIINFSNDCNGEFGMNKHSKKD